MKYLILFICLFCICGCSDIFGEKAYTGFSETKGKFVCINSHQGQGWTCYQLGEQITNPELQGSYYK